MTVSNRDRQDGDDERTDHGTDWTVVAQRRFDPDGGTEFTTALVFAIAEAAGVAPEEMTSPLYEHVDPVALEAALFRSGTAGDSRRGLDGDTVTFHYGEFRVNVGGDGWIRVEAPPGSDRSGT